jgi:hypothetical protein
VDPFAVLVFGGIGVLLLVFLALGRYYPGSGADQVDWRPTRSAELEAQLELDDIDQMLEAQNERRRASGREEITEEGVRATVEEGERWRRQQSERYTAEEEGRAGQQPD